MISNMCMLCFVLLGLIVESPQLTSKRRKNAVYIWWAVLCFMCSTSILRDLGRIYANLALFDLLFQRI